MTGSFCLPLGLKGTAICMNKSAFPGTKTLVLWIFLLTSEIHSLFLEEYIL